MPEADFKKERDALSQVALAVAGGIIAYTSKDHRGLAGDQFQRKLLPGV